MYSKILLVDDDPLLREVIGDFLSSSGYEVESAANPEEALKSFSPGKFDLALIDQNMKKSTGIKLMSELHKRDPQTYFLIMTGYANLNSVFEAVGNSWSDYIIKPFQMMELLNIVQKFA